jgi:hypothetical protein
MSTKDEQIAALEGKIRVLELEVGELEREAKDAYDRGYDEGYNVGWDEGAHDYA